MKEALTFDGELRQQSGSASVLLFTRDMDPLGGVMHPDCA